MHKGGGADFDIFYSFSFTFGKSIHYNYISKRGSWAKMEQY